VGLTLAAQLLSTEEDITYPVSIFVDNQATIKSGDLFSTKPGHYLIDHFRRIILKLVMCQAGPQALKPRPQAFTRPSQAGPTMPACKGLGLGLRFQQA
jgi:hypothetical protein